MRRYVFAYFCCMGCATMASGLCVWIGAPLEFFFLNLRVWMVLSLPLAYATRNTWVIS